MNDITPADLDPALLRNMQKEKIDTDLTLSILNRHNRGEFDYPPEENAFHIPDLSSDIILDLRGAVSFTVARAVVERCAKDAGLPVNPVSFAVLAGDTLVYDSRGLARLGTELLPFTAYGVLNGGSASSYIDPKKNRAFNESLFTLYADEFSRMDKFCAGKPKGVTPAFRNQDGTPGPSFLELKLRSLLLQSYRYAVLKKKTAPFHIPFFQMTSVQNDRDLTAAFQTFAESPLLGDLMAATGFTIDDILTGVQPLIAVYTHSSEGKAKRIFSRADGKEHNPLAMPGGHGQNFFVLRDIYRTLYERGIRFAYLGNVDNLGFTVNPVSLALTFLSGADAAFEFSFRTPVDVKGGLLVEDERGRLDCRDIGAAVSFQEVLSSEKQGKKILFNCALGLFNLSSLVKNNERIIRDLPMRFSDQDKQAGRYSQAEQITWEVVGLLEHPLILGVDKFDRFLAVKVLLEGLMTSGLKLDDPAFPRCDDEATDIFCFAQNLHQGLVKKLSTVYGMKEAHNRWVPKSLQELAVEIKTGESFF